MANITPTINIIHPSIEIITPGTDSVSKVARMARICYRTPDRGPEVDNRILTSCITRGHTSVIEHSYVSVFFSGQNQLNVKELGMDVPADSKISTRSVWNMFDSPDKRRFSNDIWDQEIYKEIESTAANPRAYRTTCANFRAWINILNSLLTVSIQQGIPLYVAFVSAVICEMFHKYPVIFADLVNSVNEAFAACEEHHYLRDWFLPKATNPEEAKELAKRKLTLADFQKFVDWFGIVVADASPKASFSAIWTTSRAVTHEVVRHRACSFSQESQRYVNFGGKGFDFIAPSLDPVKFKGAQFLVADDDEHTHFADLEPLGYIREDTCLFRRWHRGVEDAVNDYVDQMYSIGYTDVDEKTGERVSHDLPAEFCRGALNNDSATTIGITWTPDGFINYMKWRLDDAAYWPFRRQVGLTFIQGLSMKHPFFDNFAPGMIRGWIESMIRMGILTEDDPRIADLLAYQDKRQKVFDDAQKQLEQQMLARAQADKEAAAKAAAAKAEQKPSEDGEPDGK